MDYAVGGDRQYYPVCDPGCAELLGMAPARAVMLPSISSAACAHCFCCGRRITTPDGCLIHDAECPPYAPTMTAVFADAVRIIAKNRRGVVSETEWDQLTHLVAGGTSSSSYALAAIVLTSGRASS
jgi:hypothetical protein